MPAPVDWIAGAKSTGRQAYRVARFTLSRIFGQSRPLPPGPLGFRSIARFGDEQFYARRLRQYGPIFKVLWNRNLTVCVVGLDRARRLLALHGGALAQLTIDITPLVPKGFLRGMRRADHRTYRALILGALREGLAAENDDDLRRLARSGLAALSESTRSGRPPDAPVLEPALRDLATHALLLTFFGQRPGQPFFDRLDAGFRCLSASGAGAGIGPAQRAAFEGLRGCLLELLQELRASGVTHHASVVGRLLAQGRDEALDDTMIGNLIFMVELGRSDMRILLRWIVKHLADHPDVAATLAGPRPTRGDEAANLARSCVLETLRLEQVDALNRTLVEDVVFDGYRFPAGAALRVLLRECHRDPAAFPDPDQYAPCRFSRTAQMSRTYAPFGLGEHRCVAADLVVSFGSMFVEELVQSFTLSVIADGPVEKRSHTWEPSSTFEIALHPRAGVAS